MTGTAGAVARSIHEDVEEILLTGDEIAARVADIGAQLAADYAGRTPVLVSVLKGSIVFLADLIRAMDVPLNVDLMEVSSYGSATESSGQVRIRPIGSTASITSSIVRSAGAFTRVIPPPRPRCECTTPARPSPCSTFER